MNKKILVRFAEEIKACYDATPAPTPELQARREMTRFDQWSVVQKIAREFNPNFNADIFRKACGMDTALNYGADGPCAGAWMEPHQITKGVGVGRTVTSMGGPSPVGRDGAIGVALKYDERFSSSDGNMVVGRSNDHVAVAFNNTTHNQNQLVVLTKADARSLYACLGSVLEKVVS